MHARDPIQQQEPPEAMHGGGGGVPGAQAGRAGVLAAPGGAGEGEEQGEGQQERLSGLWRQLGNSLAAARWSGLHLGCDV